MEMMIGMYNKTNLSNLPEYVEDSVLKHCDKILNLLAEYDPSYKKTEKKTESYNKRKIEPQERFKNNKRIKTNENITTSSVEESLIRKSLINKEEKVLIVNEDTFDHSYL